MGEQHLEQPGMDQQGVAHLTLAPEAEGTGRRIAVELIDVAQPHEVPPAGPRIERLEHLVLARSHPRHGLNDILPNQSVATPSPSVGQSVGGELDTISMTSKR